MDLDLTILELFPKFGNTGRETALERFYLENNSWNVSVYALDSCEEPYVRYVRCRLVVRPANYLSDLRDLI